MIPKPEPRKRSKARRDRQEDVVKKRVRAEVAERDGDRCRARVFSACDGPLEWAHLGDHRRARTRGMSPELRHTTEGSLMMCKRHHMAYDGHRMDIFAETSRGADGPLTFDKHKDKGESLK